MNYCDVVFNTPENDLDRCALIDIDSGIRLTFRQLKECTRRLAGYFLSKGYGRGDVISMHLYNGFEAVVSHLAVQYAGMTSCLLNPLIGAQGISYYLRDSNSSCLVTHMDITRDLCKFPDNVKIIPAVEILSAARTFSLAGVPKEPVSYTPQEPSAIFYTSGTTSNPKGVLLCNQNYLDKIRIVSQFCYQYDQNDSLLCFVPFSHGFGSKFIFLPCMNACATFVTMRSFQPAKVMSTIENEGITGIFGVPSHFQQLVKFPEYFGPLRDLRFAFTAAAVLKPETAKKWKDMSGYFLDEGYGLIETCTLVTFRKGGIPELFGDIGYYPKDMVDLEIFDENDQPMKPGDRGEIVVRGGSVMLGYINRPEETASALRSGWFHTGDIGYKTEEDRVILTGRIKDIINIAGIKISPLEVEVVLDSHPLIDESVVIGVEDNLYGESIKAYVRKKEGSALTERELVKYAQQYLGSFQVPKEIKFVDIFPRNNLGKIDKMVLKDGNIFGCAEQSSKF